MATYQKSLFFCIFALIFTGCLERAEEQVVAYHANGEKRTSVWVFTDGEIAKRVEWYGNGIKEMEIPYKDGVPHGSFKRWTDLGDVSNIGKYRYGKKNGKWTSYYSNKKVEAKRYYKEDHPIGDWVGYFYNREKSFEEHFDNNGDTIGIWKRWHSNGKLIEENTCHSKNATGKITTYTIDGHLELTAECQYGKFHGKVQNFYPSGKLEATCQYSNGKRNGKCQIFTANGKLLRTEYWKMDIRDSLWVWYNGKDSTVQKNVFHNGAGTSYGPCPLDLGLICSESTFVDNKLDGKTWYYKTGRILRFEEVWVKGVISESRSFYPDSMGGTMASEGFWKNGKREGAWRNWYPSGVLMDSLNFVDGERRGDQFGYDSTGKMVHHREEAGKKGPVIMHLLN
ncbi:MAG: hypothetical protein HUK21_06075 [Fibrobacteraceae bacterium]|nr:hypothetical protein [Fibrobacteraceae bacterium]